MADRAEPIVIKCEPELPRLAVELPEPLMNDESYLIRPLVKQESGLATPIIKQETELAIVNQISNLSTPIVEQDIDLSIVKQELDLPATLVKDIDLDRLIVKQECDLPRHIVERNIDLTVANVENKNLVLPRPVVVKEEPEIVEYVELQIDEDKVKYEILEVEPTVLYKPVASLTPQ